MIDLVLRVNRAGFGTKESRSTTEPHNASDYLQVLYTLPMIGDMDSALAINALMIGGVAVARALNDEELSRQLLEACYKTSERLM